MTQAVSLYRRHRPASFDQVVGQRHVVRTLSNAIEQDKVHHAYLFVGSRGTGKTSMAKILAASLNCERGGPTLTPCGECESCRSIASGNSVDVIEMDAASNRSVDDIRSLRDRVAFAPTSGRWKVYILDEAHMLTKEAWNAFLKTLEEPPPNTVFILATTEAHKVMPTIADRCQRFDFQRPSIEQLSEVVSRVATAEQIGIDPAAISMVARAASGSFRDALGTLDQLVAFSGQEVALDDVLELLGAADAEILFGVVDSIIAADPRGVLTAVESVARTGQDPARFARDLLGHLRVLLVTQTTGDIPEAFAVTSGDADRLRRQASGIGPANLIRTIDELAGALGTIREGDEARLAVEVALLKAARPDFDPSTAGMMRRLERLEQSGPPAGPGTTDEGSPGSGAADGRTPGSGASQSVDQPLLPEEPGAVPAAPSPAPASESAAPPVAASAIPADAPPHPGSESPADTSPDSGSDAPTRGTEAGPIPAPTDITEAPSATPVVSSDPISTPAPDPASSSAPASAATSGPTSAPASAPAPSAPAALDQARLAQLWPAVLDALRAATPGPVASYFEGTRPVGVDGNRVEIGFPADAAFNRRNAEKPERREKLVEALVTVTGETVQLSFTTLETGPAAVAEPTSPALDEDELVAKIESEFNAKEVI